MENTYAHADSRNWPPNCPSLDGIDYCFAVSKLMHDNLDFSDGPGRGSYMFRIRKYRRTSGTERTPTTAAMATAAAATDVVMMPMTFMTRSLFREIPER